MAIPVAAGMIGSALIGGFMGRSNAKRQARAAAAEAARNREFLNQKQREGFYGQQIAAGAGLFDPQDQDAQANFMDQYGGKSRYMFGWDMNNLESGLKSDMSDGYNAFNELTGGLRNMMEQGTEVAQQYTPMYDGARQTLGEIYDGTFENQQRQFSRERQGARDSANLANQARLNSLRSGNIAQSYRGGNAASGGSTRLTGDMVRASMPFSTQSLQSTADTQLANIDDRAGTDLGIRQTQLNNTGMIQSLAGQESALPYMGISTGLNQMDRYINSMAPYRVGPSAASGVIAPVSQTYA